MDLGFKGLGLGLDFFLIFFVMKSTVDSKG